MNGHWEEKDWDAHSDDPAQCPDERDQDERDQYQTDKIVVDRSYPNGYIGDERQAQPGEHAKQGESQMTKHMELTKSDDLNGTSLQGHCQTTYDELVEQLGEPHRTDGTDKTTTEWCFRLGVTVFTVYDWKTPTRPEGIYMWHIGGADARAVEAFERASGLSAKRGPTF